MIYSQTPFHNGLVRVSIKVDRDGATLTFLDTQWSAALSVPPSHLQSLHLFFFFFISPPLSLLHSHRDAHTQVLATPPPSPPNITHSSKIPNRYFVSSFNFGSVTAEQTRNIITQETELCWSSRLLSSDSA